jgi:anthranilate synthase component 1
MPGTSIRAAMITELEFKSLAAQGYNRIPLISRGLCRPRDAAVAVPEAGRRQPPQLPARVGGRRRALRPLQLHRPAGAHAAARHRLGAPKSSPTAQVVETHEGNPLDFIAAYQAALQGGAAARAAALLRRAGRLLRLRRGALHRAAAGRHRKTGGMDTPDILLLQTEELAVIDNLSGRLYLIVWADPGTARGLLLAASGACRNWPTSCATASPRRRSSAGRRMPWSASSQGDYLAAVQRARTTSPPAT